MQKKLNLENGFSVIEVLLVFIIVVVIGFIGYRVYSANSDKEDQSSNIKQDTAESESLIESKEDLSKASEELRNNNTDTKDQEDSLKKLVE